MGYDVVHFVPLTFCPLGLGSYGCGDKYIATGQYKIDADDLPALVEHCNRLLSTTNRSMLLACSRLADAENRSRPDDRIIDAVIGMEALLLAAIEKGSELSFRFALNYAMLFEGAAARRQAFKMAKCLYNLRSTIAHGSTPNQKDFKIAGETLADAGKIATDALRLIITRFLGDARLLYQNHEFWLSAYLGGPDIDESATKGSGPH